jgi:hypothetical protein
MAAWVEDQLAASPEQYVVVVDLARVRGAIS